MSIHKSIMLKKIEQAKVRKKNQKNKKNTVLYNTFFLFFVNFFIKTLGQNKKNRLTAVFLLLVFLKVVYLTTFTALPLEYFTINTPLAGSCESLAPKIE